MNIAQIRHKLSDLHIQPVLHFGQYCCQAVSRLLDGIHQSLVLTSLLHLHSGQLAAQPIIHL